MLIHHFESHRSSHTPDQPARSRLLRFSPDFRDTAQLIAMCPRPACYLHQLLRHPTNHPKYYSSRDNPCARRLGRLKFSKKHQIRKPAQPWRNVFCTKTNTSNSRWAATHFDAANDTNRDLCENQLCSQPCRSPRCARRFVRYIVAMLPMQSFQLVVKPRCVRADRCASLPDNTALALVCNSSFSERIVSGAQRPAS